MRYTTPLLRRLYGVHQRQPENVMRNFQYHYKPTIPILVPLFVNTIYKRIMDTARKKGVDQKLEVATQVTDTLRVAGVDLRRAPVCRNYGDIRRQARKNSLRRRTAFNPEIV